MSGSDYACKAIVEKIKGVVGDNIDDATSAKHEEMFVALVQKRTAQNARKKVIYVGFAAAAAIAAGVMLAVFLPSYPAQLPFTVGVNQRLGEAGDWVETGRGEKSDIKFVQGSVFTLENLCAARIVESNEEQVTIELSKGVVLAKVHKNKKTRWSVNAGPFTITVLGTEFKVRWNAKGSEIDVAVTRGVVLVQGAGLSRHGVKLVAGQSLTANGRSGEVALNNTTKVDGIRKEPLAKEDFRVIDTSIDSNKSDFEAEDKLIKQKSRRMGNRYGKSSIQNGWMVHYAHGRFKEAVGAAQEFGLGRIYQTSSATELWNLADAARNAGRTSISNSALIQLRKRFGKSKKAKLAAFIIGRSAMDKSSSPKVAAQWFKAYLGEAPKGAMSEEAHGRLMALYEQMGRKTAARGIANQYLRRFPNGLYTRRATQVLQP